MNNKLLECINITKSFRKKNEILQILNGVDLIVNEGDLICIHGKSGAGKSVLLSLLSGIDLPSSGEIFFEDRSYSALSLDELTHIRNNKISIIFQNFNLISYWTALENVEAVMIDNEISNVHIREKAKKVLDELGLSNRLNNFPNELSIGEQQRVAIARTLVKNTKLILADDPIAELDEKTSEKIMEILYKHVCEKKISMIIATHSDDIPSFANQVMMLVDGKLIIG